MNRLLTLIVLLMLVGCGIHKPQPVIIYQNVVEYRDSLIVKDSLIYVPLPAEQSTNVLHPTDTSRLETSLAESEAWVDSTGLHHTIRNKREPFGVIVPITTHILVDKAHTNETHYETVEVEKPLSWWQSFRMGAFWWLLGAVVVMVGILTLKKR